MRLLRSRYVQPVPDGGDGEFLDYRETYRPHPCSVPGPLDRDGDYRGGLASGAIWRCRKCGSVWHLSEYYFAYRKWFRREDPGEDAFKATHDSEGHPLGAS